ncbi:hypothetical protein fugu_003495 [Takifugu bimaculatus]|uniref:Uncharacterized protein n=1 Tax=Takifugu bimaculatus TaxID=433685 RepID=A0A4Z2BI02_9TELE|nr:hypothetical protein fugu_003495 [Takifugu bimaculatus]
MIPLPDSTSPPFRPGHDEAAGPLRFPVLRAPGLVRCIIYEANFSNLSTGYGSRCEDRPDRSDRPARPAGQPGVRGGAGGGCSARRRRPGGEGRCLRSRCRADSAGMLASCLLSAGMLSLLVRCAGAAEDAPSYDASGSSALQSDPTAAPARPVLHQVNDAEHLSAPTPPLRIVAAFLLIQQVAGAQFVPSSEKLQPGRESCDHSWYRVDLMLTRLRSEMGRRLIIGSWQPDKRNVDVFISDAATGTADDPYLLCPAVRECPPLTSVESTAGGHVGGTKSSVVLTEERLHDRPALTPPKAKVGGPAPSHSVGVSLAARPTERTPQVSPLPPPQDTTTASFQRSAATPPAAVRPLLTPAASARATRVPPATTTAQPAFTRRAGDHDGRQDAEQQEDFCPAGTQSEALRGGAPLSSFPPSPPPPSRRCSSATSARGCG